MKNKTLKTVSLFLAVILALTCFSACGKKESAEIGNGSDVILNGDKIYPIQCDDTLTFWFAATTIWNQKYENFADTPIGKEVAKKTGVKVEYLHPVAGQEAEQFQILMASDELPDIANNTWYSFAGGPDSAIEQDYIYELSDIIDKYCPSLKALLKENPSWDSEIKTDSNNYYAFPYIRGTDPITKVVWGPIVRGDWAEELNLDLPVTIDDWEKMLQAFKDEKGAAIPFSGDATAMCYTFYPAFGGSIGWYQDNGTVKYGQAQPQYKDYLIKMSEWYQKGLIDADFAVFDSTKFQSNVLNNKVGAFAGYVGSGLGTLLEANEGKGTFDLAGAQYPVMKSGDTNAEYSRLNREVDTGTSTAISKNCKNVELAARFLDWGYSEEGHEVYNFGVEGESYNWVDKDGENYPLYSDLVYNNPENLSMSDVLHMYTRAAHSNVPMVLDARYTVQYYSLPQQVKAQEEWAKTNMDEHNMPAIYILGEENDTDADIMAAVKTYVDEMTIKFITGREPIEKFDEYLKQLDEFGLQTSVQFRQKALERYNSR